jgi:hypothetical protein
VSTTTVLSSSAVNAFAIVINVGIAETTETSHLLLLLSLLMILVVVALALLDFFPFTRWLV